jgi:hypothetical protein
MPSFTVTSAGQSVPLDQAGGGQAAFTVTNTTTTPMRGRLLATPIAPAAPEWFTVAAPTTRDFAPGAAESVTAQVVVPAGTAPGTYTFRIDAVAEANPDEDFTEGPPVSFEVKAAEVKKKPFPWWILIIVALVLIGGGVAFALTRGGGKPGTPKISAPLDKFPIPAVPATLQIQWRAVKKADAYDVEVQRCASSACTDQNSSALGAPINVKAPATNADVTVSAPTSGRYRVTAVKGKDKGTPSQWRTFAFIGPGGGPVRPGDVCLKCVKVVLERNPAIDILQAIKTQAQKAPGP